MAKVAAFLIANLELILAGMSLPVIAILHVLVSERFDDPWKITAAAALAVGVLHGAIGWFVRARQRSSRLVLLRRLSAILQGASAPPVSETEAAAVAARLSESDIRLALAQLVAVVREPLVVKVVPVPARAEMNLPREWTT
jgi:hypothetical protein